MAPWLTDLVVFFGVAALVNIIDIVNFIAGDLIPAIYQKGRYLGADHRGGRHDRR